MAGGQVAARHRQRLQIAAIGKLRRVVGRMTGRLCRKRARYGQRGEGECGNGPAIETNGKHTVRLAPGFYGSSRMRTQPAASRQPTMPRLALNRKDTGWSIDWQKGPMATDLASAPDSKRFQCGGIVAGDRTGGHQLTQSWSHGLVIGPAAAFRRNPGDVAVGILHVAGFAVDAILGVDDKAWPGRLLDPFIDARRAIAVGRAGIDIVLGCLLQ